MSNSVSFRSQVAPVSHEIHGFAYCPICTHTVEATVVASRKTAKVKPGQKCARCSASLDPAIVVRMDRAA